MIKFCFKNSGNPGSCNMYSLTTLSCPVYEYEGKVGRNSSIERLTLFYNLPHLAKVSITTTHYLCWRWSNRPRFSQGENPTSLSHVWYRPRTNMANNRIKSTSQFRNSYQLFPHTCKQGRTKWLDCTMYILPFF